MAVLQSLAAQLRPTNANFGEKLAGLRATGENIASSQQRRGVVDRQQKMQQVQFINRLAKSLKGKDPSEWGQTLTPHLPVLQQIGFDPRQLQGLTPQDIDGVIARTDAALGPQGQPQVQASAGQRERADLMRDLQGGLDGNGNLKPEKDLTAKQKAAAISLKLMPGAGNITGEQRTAMDAGLTKKVAKSKSEIAAAVKLATKAATDRGEALTDLNRMEAALPGLQEVVGSLKELTPFATSTLGGKFFDSAVKETGFGATKGATARAKYIAIIDNQILPLLKQTFGTAFTVQEGERLRATLGDPDTTPDAKNAQLDAFIEAKQREIQTKNLEIQGGAPEAEQGVVDWSAL